MNYYSVKFREWMAVDSGHVAFCFFLCNFSIFLGNCLGMPSASFWMTSAKWIVGIYLILVAFFFQLYCIKTAYVVGKIQFENEYHRASGLLNCAIVLLEVFYLGWFIISIIKDFRFI